MSVALVSRIFKDAVQNGGLATKALLAATYPNDVQFQFVALELTNYRGDTLDMLIFPITPAAISQNKVASIDIKKSASGVVTHYNPFFVPHEISIRGTFGRSFKIMIGRREFSGSAFRVLPDAPPDYDFSIKSGYGISKVLERIIVGSRRTDEQGRSNMLFFYNAMANMNYVVEVPADSYEMTEEKNDLVNYSLRMKAVAPSSATLSRTDQTSLGRVFTLGLAGKILTNVSYAAFDQIGIQGRRLLLKL